MRARNLRLERDLLELTGRIYEARTRASRAGQVRECDSWDRALRAAADMHRAIRAAVAREEETHAH